MIELGEALPLQVLDRPFSLDRREVDVEAGLTIAQLLEVAGIPRAMPVRVYLNGDLIYPEFYHRIRPKRGAHVLVRVVPRGGGQGGGKSMNIGQIIVGVLLEIIATVLLFTPLSPASLPLIMAGAAMISGALLNMLLPGPKQAKPLKGLAGVTSANNPESPTLSIAGQANTARPYAVVPRIYGRHKTYPPYAAMPYTEMVGADQYLRLLFCVGLGPTEIDDLRIGETALANFQGVETEVRAGWPDEPPITLYTTDVNETPLSIVLLAGQPQIRTSTAHAIELSIDLAFPEGLVEFGGETGTTKLATTVSVDVDYRAVGATSWIAAPGSPLVTTDARQSLARNGLRWAVADDQYDVRLTRTTPDSGDPLVKNTSVWTSLRSYGAGAPVNLPGLALVAMRIKATDQLNGVVDQFNCIAHSLHLDFTTHPAVVLEDNPLGYWRLGEVAGAPTAFDASGNDHPGAYRGSPQLGGPGLLTDDPDTAMLADGIDDGVDTFNEMATLDMGAGSFTIECVFQAATLNGTRGLLRKSNGLDFAAGAAGWALQLHGTMLEFCRGAGTGTPTVLSASLVSGTIYHAMVVYDIATGLARLWLNGLPVNTANVGTTPYADTFNLELCHDRSAAARGAPRRPRALVSVSYFAPRYFHAGYFATGYFIFAVIEGVVGAVAPYFYAIAPTIEPEGGAGSAPPPFMFAVADPDAVGGRFAGTLDEVAVYAGALSDARVALHAETITGTGGWVVRRTSNPASHYREVLQGGVLESKSNARPVPDSRLDLPALEAWHRENSSGGRSHNRVVDFPTTVYQLLREIAMTGRATPTMNDLKFATVRDLAQSVPRQVFTPRNSRNFRGSRQIPDEVHALKVGFVDPQSNWQQVERIAYQDGYGAVAGPGVVAATRFESMDLPGCTDPDWAWRWGRYQLAAATLRPETYSFETDLENLACRRGDLIQVAHDVTEWGIAWGRVKSVATTPSGLGTSVTLDEAIPMSTGQVYAMRFRFSDLGSVVVPVQTPPGPGLTHTLTFPTPMVPPLPEPGDLAVLGIIGRETIPAIVAMIRPGPDLTAMLTVVDAAPAVLTADQLTIPPWDPQMTLPIATEQAPPTPIIEAVVSDESVLVRDLDGSLRAAIIVTLRYLSTSNVRADYLEARIRRTGATSPYDILPQLAAGATRVLFTEVEEGIAYDLRLRTVNRSGQASPWAEVLNYTVIGKTTPPPAPQNLRTTTPDLTRLEWDYPAPPPDLDGFLVRGLPGSLVSWPGALPLHVGVVSASPFILPPMFGQWTLLVAAVDTSGNESEASSVVVTFVDVRIHNQVTAFDYKAAGWPGTITNGVILGGNLAAAGVPTIFWGADTAKFWVTDPLALFWAGTYQQMVYEFDYTVSGDSVGARILLQTTMVAESWTLEYAAESAASSLPIPYFGPGYFHARYFAPGYFTSSAMVTTTVWLPFPGSLENVEAGTYHFRIITGAAASQAVLSRLNLVIDADTITEDQNNVAIAITTGTRLTLQNTYRAILNVQATALTTNVAPIVVDKQNVAGANNGPLIRCYALATGASAAGTVDVHLTGY